MRLRHLTAVIAAATASVLLVSACVPQRDQVLPATESPWTTPAPGDTGGGVPEDFRLYDQRVDWQACGGLECGTVIVPVDWTDPNGPTIEIAVNRSKALDPEARIGSVLINPGGPGGSGIELTAYLAGSSGDALRDHFDIVGFDPRGVGESAPVQCGTAAELDAYLIEDYIIDTEAALQEGRERNAAFAARCRELSGAVVENMDTVSVARDMDVIRAAVGDDKLYYLGFSYGTQLGATYATLYPDQVGRMVLDGAVDFLLPEEEVSRGQSEGFEDALDAYIADCLTSASCPLPDDPAAAKAKIGEISRQARDNPFPSGEDQPVNGNLMVYGIVVTLYDEGTWSYLTEALDEAINEGTATLFYELANFYLDRDPGTGEYLGNSSVVFPAVGCLDEGPSDEWTIDDMRDFQREADAVSPTFGWWFASSVGCEGWPWEGKQVVTSLETATTSTPILVVGTTGDPATPFEWSESLTNRLPNASLLVYEGEGHTAYGRSNDCITDAIDSYLVDGIVPDSGKRC